MSRLEDIMLGIKMCTVLEAVANGDKKAKFKIMYDMCSKLLGENLSVSVIEQASDKVNHTINALVLALLEESPEPEVAPRKNSKYLN